MLSRAKSRYIDEVEENVNLKPERGYLNSTQGKIITNSFVYATISSLLLLLFCYIFGLI